MIQILKSLPGNDTQMELTLTDSDVRIDWNGVEEIHAVMYSDEQRVVSGSIRWSIDKKDGFKLNAVYPADEPQYYGLNRVILSCRLKGVAKTYACPVVEYVRTAEEQGTGSATVASVELVSGNISSDLILGLLAYCNESADRAVEATTAAQNQTEEQSRIFAEKMQQIATLTETLTASVNTVISESKTATGNANDQAAHAQTQGNYAKEQGIKAGAAANAANTAASSADTKMQEIQTQVSDLLRLLSDAISEAEAATSRAGISADNADAATKRTETATDNANTQAEAAKTQAEAARLKLEELETYQAALTALQSLVEVLYSEGEAFKSIVDNAGHHRAMSYDTETGYKVCGKPMILTGHGVPSADTIPDQKGIPASVYQVYINLDASSNGRYYAVGTNSVSDWRN